MNLIIEIIDFIVFLIKKKCFKHQFKSQLLFPSEFYQNCISFLEVGGKKKQNFWGVRFIEM